MCECVCEVKCVSPSTISSTGSGYTQSVESKYCTRCVLMCVTLSRCVQRCVCVLCGCMHVCQYKLCVCCAVLASVLCMCVVHPTAGVGSLT